MHTAAPRHPSVSRRTMLQAGSIGLLGLGDNHVAALRDASANSGSTGQKVQSVILVFLSGGLTQHDSFDPKPDAPDTIRGEFNPIDTATPGIQICEHLPMLAQRSRHWALVRSLTHPTNGHTLGHYFMLTGRSVKSPGFRGDRKPRPNDWPAIASIVGDAVPPQTNNLPPAVMLPERLVHWSGGVIPGAYGGQMGAHRDPFIIGATHYGDPFWRGAYPEYTFHQLPLKKATSTPPKVFQAPSLKLPGEVSGGRFGNRLDLLTTIDAQRTALEESAAGQSYDLHRQSAISLLASQEVRRAIDVTRADPKTQERYGKNSFGWSLLMANRLVEAGVPMIQVNLGNNEGWDTHGEAFWRLREKLLPPTDRAIAALLDDLDASGLLESTMVVMAGEFGRTPRIFNGAPSVYKLPGRDHWAPCQSVLFAGGGVKGGRVIGSSDRNGAYPASDPQTPENFAATIYQALRIDPAKELYDGVRPVPITDNGRALVRAFA